MKFTTRELREMFKNFYKSKRSKDIEKKTSNKLLEEAAPEILEALIIAYKWLKNKDELCEDCQNQDCVLCHEGACQGNIIKKAIEKAKGMRIEEVLNNE
jgi:hydroxymethylpyrimidine pyrophosphatase-like HAD family hydrolase